MSTNCGKLKGRNEHYHTSNRIISNSFKHIVDVLTTTFNAPKLVQHNHQDHRIQHPRDLWATEQFKQSYGKESALRTLPCFEQ